MTKFLLTLAALGLFLVMAVVAFGATPPEFPFQNMTQLVTQIPGVEARGSQPASCGAVQGWKLEFMVGTVVWDLFVVEGRLVGAAYTEIPGLPTWLYFGTYNPENYRITITHTEAFDPTKHLSPCTWLVPVGA